MHLRERAYLSKGGICIPVDVFMIEEVHIVSFVSVNTLAQINGTTYHVYTNCSKLGLVVQKFKFLATVPGFIFIFNVRAFFFKNALLH